MKNQKRRAFTLTELLTVSVIVAIIAAMAIAGYEYYKKMAAISVLKNAVMLNVELIQAYYDIHGVWVTDVMPGPDGINLTTGWELHELGLVQRNLSQLFMIRVFTLDGYPHIIAREQIGQKKFRVKVSYHFKDRKLKVEDLDESDE